MDTLQVTEGFVAQVTNIQDAVTLSESLEAQLPGISQTLAVTETIICPIINGIDALTITELFTTTTNNYSETVILNEAYTCSETLHGNLVKHSLTTVETISSIITQSYTFVEVLTIVEGRVAW